MKIKISETIFNIVFDIFRNNELITATNILKFYLCNDMKED